MVSNKKALAFFDTRAFILLKIELSIFLFSFFLSLHEINVAKRSSKAHQNRYDRDKKTGAISNKLLKHVISCLPDKGIF